MPHSSQTTRGSAIGSTASLRSIDHPNVIPVYEAGEWEGQLFIAMRFVEGTDLRALLHRIGAIDEARTVDIINQVAAALDAAHERGLVHRDVKPANILLSRTSGNKTDEHVYLSDFGLTKRSASDSGITGTGQFVGTLDYAAPEQFEGKTLDPRTDVYSLGCVLFECLAGHPPFRSGSDAALMYAHLLDEPPSLTRQRPGLPSEIDGVIATALAKAPADRPRSAGELARTAGRALGHEVMGQHAGERPRRRPRWLLPAVAVALVVALAAVVLPAITGGEPSLEQTEAGIAILDATTGERVAFIPPSTVRAPVEAFYANGHFWVLDRDGKTLVEIQPRTGKVLQHVSVPVDDPAAFAIEGSTLWTVDSRSDALVKYDLSLGRELDRIDLAQLPNVQPGGSASVLVSAGSVWVTRVGGPDKQIVRLDLDTLELQHVFDELPSSFDLASETDSVWSAGFGQIRRIDPRSDRVIYVNVSGTISTVAAGGGFGWAADETQGVVYKIHSGGAVVHTFRTGEGAKPLAFSDGVLWVGNQDAGTLVGIDAETDESTTYAFEHPLGTVAAGGGLVLLSLAPGRTLEDPIASLQGDVARLLVAPPYQLGSPDPAVLDDSFPAREVAFATCAKLLNYPDQNAPLGGELQAEVAASMPRVSNDGRTYTFTIRPGYRFSPPSNEPVTAETFRYSIERALSPKMGEDAPGPMFVDDIAGQAAFGDGQAAHLSGLEAQGDTLTITLSEPSASFLDRLALPYFCPVPIGTAVVPGGAVRFGGSAEVGVVPSAGPYYIAAFDNGEYLILKRNPNYTGPRPHALDAIALREGIDPTESLDRVEGGAWDGMVGYEEGPYSGHNPASNILHPLGDLALTWGPGTEASRQGDQRYFAVPVPILGAIAFNASRPPFSDPKIRRAVAFQIHREFLAEVFSAIPTSELLPPSQPGYAENADPYPLDGPDLDAALALMDGRTFTVRMAVEGDCVACGFWTIRVVGGLEAIGIRVKVVWVEDPKAAVRVPGADYDLFNPSSFQEYADPVTFLAEMFGGQVPESWLPSGVRSDIERVDELSGRERTEAAGDLALKLAMDDVPATAFGYGIAPAFLSPRLGCRVFPPLGFGVDLAALCLNEG